MSKNKETIDYLTEFMNELNSVLSLEYVILFGSRARKDFTSHSDVDLILIGDFREKFIKRGAVLYEKFDFRVGLDAFCYTPKEFEKMFQESIVSILDAIDEGICLLGREFFKRFKKKINKLKSKGLRKEPPVWILPKSMAID